MKLFVFSLATAIIALAGSAAQAQTTAKTVTRVPVVFEGGHETEGRDGGRPIVLIAAALGVTSDVFRTAFSNVHPAGPGSGGPKQEEARANKAVLMAALGKHGVTNDRLNEVSNFYRYVRSRGELWTNKPAAANALVQNGVVTGYEIVSAGAGYSSAPTVTVPNVPGAAAKVNLAFGKDLTTNGSISAITLPTAGKVK